MPRRNLEDETLAWTQRMRDSCDTGGDLLGKCEVKDRSGVIAVVTHWAEHVVDTAMDEDQDPRLVVRDALCWAMLLGGHLEREGLL